MWFLSQMSPESSVYNVTRAFRIRGPLKVDALERAIDGVISRHEVLRTSVVTTDDIPMQVVDEEWSFDLPITYLEEGEAELKRLLLKEARQPFDLSTDLMLRARLARVDDDTHALLIVVHHIAFDGWSERILLDELGTLYESFSAGRRPDLSKLPIQYADYATWQRQRLDQESYDAHRSYWTEQLAGISNLDLPSDRPRPAVQTFRGGKLVSTPSRDLKDSLEALSRQSGVTLFMTLLAAFATLLHRYTSDPDIVVGSPIAGRIRVETEELIGFFINTLVVQHH